MLRVLLGGWEHVYLRLWIDMREDLQQTFSRTHFLVLPIFILKREAPGVKSIPLGAGSFNLLRNGYIFFLKIRIWDAFPREKKTLRVFLLICNFN